MVYALAAPPSSEYHFEVDSTESVWYTELTRTCGKRTILKLTPQSQYGIIFVARVHIPGAF